MAEKLCAFPWYGGKTSHLKWLLPLIDNTQHKTYVEPFGGSAAVLLNKKPAPIEVYNDIYSDVVNFFKTLREQGDKLLPLLQLTPYSREEFAASCKNDDADEPLERARKFFIRARQVRTGLVTTASPGRWAYVIGYSRRGVSMSVSSWLSAVDGLEDICARLREVQLENLDAIDVMSRYDTPETLHYVDPPYIMASRTGGVGYAHECSDDKHKELLTVLKALQGKVILSGYDNDMYNDVLPGWHKYSAEAKFAASTRNKGQEPKLRQEIVWSNFMMSSGR
jgi:DNA adenine methylase